MFAPKYEQKEILKFTLDSSLDDDKWTVLALKEFGPGMAKSCEPTLGSFIIAKSCIWADWRLENIINGVFESVRKQLSDI